MIKINLALKKQAAASSEGKGSKLSLDTLSGLIKGKIDLNSVRDFVEGLPLRKYASMLAVAIVATSLLNWREEKVQERWIEAIDKLKAEQTQLKLALAKTKGFEDIKKSLDADDAMIRTKINVIQKLIADRQTPPKLLLSLSAGIPSEVWLSNFKFAPDGVNLKGYSLGFNQISDFMKNLGENAYFTDLKLQSTQQGKDDTGLTVAIFELSAKRR